MSWPKDIAILCGGVGGSRFLRGLARVFENERITAIVNTGDDIILHGLHISPDVDIIIYSLAGLIDDKKGWGIEGDSFRCLEAMGRLGVETWFALGDVDLATHIYRTQLLEQGLTLSEATRKIAEALGVRVRVIPMTDQRFETQVKTPSGWVNFQEYLVKRQMRDEILELRFAGGEKARPAPGVLDSISKSDLVILPPSNPFVSTGTILSLPGVRKAMASRKGPTVAISPVIGGKVVKGPLAKMMESQGMGVSSLSVARIYQGLLKGFALDHSDARYADDLRRAGVMPYVTDIMIPDLQSSTRLAKEVLEFSRSLT